MAVHRVLVVDDNHEIRRMVTASIKTLGTDVDVLDVPSAEEALFISASLPLDLMVLDYRLPGMSGLEMVSRLRKQKPETKIILVTGVEDATSRQQISEAGVAAYFFKPIEIATFLNSVRQCLWSDVELSQPVVRENINREAAGVSSVGKGKPAPKSGAKSTLDQRLTRLKQQIQATSVLLVNEMGQIVEVAGNPSPITSGSVLLPALMDTFRTSLRVTDALGKDSTESLHYFDDAKQRIYLVPVDPSNALLMVTVGHVEPDKIGLLDRAIHLAVQDLRGILEHIQEEENLQPAIVETTPVELPAETVVDPETLAGVVKMFSKVPREGGKQEADGYWDTVGESDQPDSVRSRDVLSYDQAQDMGLTPKDEQQS